MLQIDAGNGPVSPRALEDTSSTNAAPAPTSSAAPSVPDAAHIAKYAQSTQPQDKISSALGKPVAGANIWGVGIGINSGAERKWNNGPQGRQLTETTQSSSTQLNYKFSNQEGAVRTQTSVTIASKPGEQKPETPSSSDKEPTLARSAYRNTSFSVASWNPDTPAGSLASATLSGHAGSASGSLTASALGYRTNAGASVSGKNGALVAEAHGGADVYLGKVAASGQIDLPDHASLSGQGSAEVGAGADGSAQTVFDPSQGSLDTNVDASGFVGAKAQGTASAGIGPLGANAQGDIGAGLGAGIDANVGIEKGKLNFDFGLQAYLGIGAGGSLSFSVNVPQVADGLAHDATSIAHTLSSGWHDVTSFF